MVDLIAARAVVCSRLRLLRAGRATILTMLLYIVVGRGSALVALKKLALGLRNILLFVVAYACAGFLTMLVKAMEWAYIFKPQFRSGKLSGDYFAELHSCWEHPIWSIFAWPLHWAYVLIVLILRLVFWCPTLDVEQVGAQAVRFWAVEVAFIGLFASYWLGACGHRPKVAQAFAFVLSAFGSRRSLSFLEAYNDWLKCRRQACQGLVGVRLKACQLLYGCSLLWLMLTSLSRVATSPLIALLRRD